MPSPPLSRRAYAAARGCSEKAVRKAIARGLIKPLPSGKIDPGQADEGWYRWSLVSVRDNQPARQAEVAKKVSRSSGKSAAAVGYPDLLADPKFTAGIDELLHSATADPELDYVDDDLSLCLSTVLEIKREIAALRREVPSSRSSFGQCRAFERRPDNSEITSLRAHFDLHLGVAFHQLERAIRGLPLTVADDVFPENGALEDKPFTTAADARAPPIDLSPLLSTAIAANRDQAPAATVDLAPVLNGLAEMRAALDLGLGRVNDYLSRLITLLLGEAQGGASSEGAQ